MATRPHALTSSDQSSCGSKSTRPNASLLSARCFIDYLLETASPSLYAVNIIYTSIAKRISSAITSAAKLKGTVGNNDVRVSV